MRWTAKGSAVDSHDVATLRRAAFRTRLVRVVLVVVAVALLAGAAASARGLDAGRTDGLPSASGIVVIDLSLSIGPDDYRAIRATLRRLIASDGSLGLVIRRAVACGLCDRERTSSIAASRSAYEAFSTTSTPSVIGRSPSGGTAPCSV